VENRPRLLRMQELIQEAESLATEEVHCQFGDRRLTRLSAVLWVCRDVIDEVVEEQVHKPEPPEGRPNREH
jgi:hypothetical protein